MALVGRLILLYSSRGELILDPFAGTGTVGKAARLLSRHVWMIEREAKYWPRLEAVLSQTVLPDAINFKAASPRSPQKRLVQTRLPKAA